MKSLNDSIPPEFHWLAVALLSIALYARLAGLFG